jgi:hypothetical protein
MSSKNTRLTSFVFVVLLALSGASFGFLLGRSHQMSSESTTTEQLQNVSHQVKTSGAIISRGADAVRRLLVK